MENDNKLAALEGLLFVVGDDGLSINQMMEILEIEHDEAVDLINKLKESYEDPNRGIRLHFLGNTFKLTTKVEHRKYYQKLLVNEENNTLSNSALETLAIVAYNEPITRIKIDEIRGVNSSQIVRRLLARGFIKICGKEDTIGKPNLYKTTNEFLDYFGLSSKDDLPEVIVEEKFENDNPDLYDSTYKEA
jgi:segregation and condensation protein B